MSAAAARLLPERPEFAGDFKSSIVQFIASLPHVYLPALDVNAWLVKLVDGSFLHIYEEGITPENFACDCCRIVGECASIAGSPAPCMTSRRSHQARAADRNPRGALGSPPPTSPASLLAKRFLLQACCHWT
jgi:hypothetical protein